MEEIKDDLKVLSYWNLNVTGSISTSSNSFS